MPDEIEPREPLDIDADRSPKVSAVLLVAAGGTAGTAARYPLSETIAHANGIPIGVVVVNVTGALLIGVLLGTLAVRVSDPRRHHHARLLFGTGVLGGYTTYSAFSLGAAELIRDGRPAAALAYGFATVAAGVVATGIGIRLAGAIGPQR